MSKRSNNWTINRGERYIKEGRGQGEGKDYKPWLTIQDFPSRGRTSRILGWKTNRVHHLFTDIETRCFYLFEWDKNVIDIREHFPLIDVGDVIKNKDEVNLDIFKDRETGCEYVITTTFLLTVKDKNGCTRLVARSVKSASELGKKTTMEKLEIERRYWAVNKGISWGVITQNEIPMQKVKNIEWVHSSLYNYEDFNLTEKEMVSLCSDFINNIESRNVSIRRITKEFDITNGLKSGTGIFIFKYLIASRIIDINMNKPINLNATCSELINHKGDEI